MAKSIAQLKHPLASVAGNFATDETFLISAKIQEGLSKITEARIVFATKDSSLQLDSLLGTEIRVELKTKEEATRKFLGTCIEAEYLGLAQGYEMFAVETRVWMWFLTQSSDNRIFQEKSIPDIVKQVCTDLGFSDIDDRLSASYDPQPYVVQYNETNYAFICRLMEEVGIYFFFDHSGAKEKLVLADGLGAHKPLPETPEIEFKPRIAKGKRDEDTIFEWAGREKVVPGKVTLQALEFTTPNTNLESKAELKKGKHARNDMELYSMDGHYKKVAEGENFARIRAEGNAHEAQRWTGAGNARTMSAGFTFKMTDHPKQPSDSDFLLLRTDHYLQIEVEGEDGEGGELEQFVVKKKLNFPDNKDIYLVDFEVAQKAEQFRPKATTSAPKMSGVHRGVVAGPSGEEIYTDEYGRIKVHFFWDRVGGNDENSSCWVRVVQPFAGKGYGTMFIPRIGSEVLIAFERDDPNYPICLGQIYNSFMPVPFELAANMTQTAIKTESTKGGGGFHELVFEDKKDEEFIRLQSEKDWFEKIKNNAEITIGMEKMDPGDMKLTVYNSMTETLKEGDHTFTVEKGKQEITIKEDHTTTIQSGDHTIKVESGKMLIDVATEIRLVTGSSSLTMKKDGTITLEGKDITIKGSGNITADASMQFKAKGGLKAELEGGTATTVKSGGLTEVKGGPMVKIN
jgi:type VI secretion system secreted protein VgrG